MASYELINDPLRNHRRRGEQVSRAPSPSGSLHTVSSLSGNEEELEELMPVQPLVHDLKSGIKDQLNQDHIGAAGESALKNAGTKKGGECSHSGLLETLGKGDMSEDVATWQPFWLRQDVLGTFACLFLLFSVTLLVLLVISHRQNGVFEARKELEILWKFAPTAIFTLVATLWGRVELQALRYFPWAVIQHEPHVTQDIYALDYNAMISIRVMFRAIRKRHFFVFSIVLVSIFLKLQVVLGPSLFYLENHPISRPAQGQILDYFATSEPEDRGDLPMLGLFHAAGVEKLGIDRPFGVSEQAAYQTFQLESENGPSRGTVESPATAVVDGIFMDVKCIPSTGYSAYRPFELDDEGEYYHTTFDLEFEGCEHSVKWDVRFYPAVLAKGEDVSKWTVLPLFSEKEDEGKSFFPSGMPISWTHGSWEDNPDPICSSLPQQFPPFVYFGSYWKPSKLNSSNYEMDDYASVICSPRGWNSKVEITDDGVRPNLTTLPDHDSTPLILNPWNIIAGAQDIRATSWSGEIVGPLSLSWLFKNDVPESNTLPNNSALYDSRILSDSILNLTKLAGPMIMNYQLRYNRNDTVTGFRQTNISKLQVRLNACILIIVLCLISSFVASAALLRFSPRFKIWARNPTTILGSALFFSSNAKISRAVKQDLLETHWSQKEKWRHSNYSPPSLRTWVRLLFVLYLLGLIIALAVTLHISQTSNGLVTLDKAVPSTWWTSVPALAMILVTIYTSLSSSEIRKLSMHFCARKRHCGAAELDLCLLDMIGFRALYHSINRRLPVVTLSQTLAIICSFLAAISSLLFTTIEVIEWDNKVFKQKSTFVTKGNASNVDYVYLASAFSMLTTYETSNPTWPMGTYGNLLFPTLDTDSLESPEDTGVVVDLVTPAATLWPNCKMVSTGDNITIAASAEDQVMLNIPIQYTCLDGSVHRQALFMASSDKVDDKYYFAGSLNGTESGSCNGTDPREVSSTVTHYWGSVPDNITAPDNSTVPDYFTIWRCEYNWVEVTTQAKMNVVDGVLQFDQKEPPKADYTNIRPWNTSFDMPEDTNNYWPKMSRADTRSGGTLGEFDLILEPFGKFKLQDLGDSTKAREILRHVQSKRAILASLLANIENRMALDESSALSPPLSKINARVSFGKTRRLDQNTIITYVIITILCMAFIVNLWALLSSVLTWFLDNKTKWLLDMQMKGVAPDEFDSIVMAESLLLGSNYPNFIPKGSCLEKPKVLHQNLAHLRFRIGGFMQKGAKEKEVTLGVLDDDEFQYLGS